MLKCECYPNCEICKHNSNCILKKDYPRELQNLEKEIQYELAHLRTLEEHLTHRENTNQIITEIEDTRKLIRYLRKEEFELNKKIGAIK